MDLASSVLDAILENLDEGVFVWDPQTRKFWASARCTDLLTLSDPSALKSFGAMCQFEDPIAGDKLNSLWKLTTIELQKINFPEKLQGVYTSSKGCPLAFQLRTFIIVEKNQAWVVCVLQDREELTQARLELQESLQSKEDFLSKVSHEIRTPLNAVVGMIHLLGQTPLTSSQKEYLSILKHSNDSIIEMITEVLDYYKIETGQIAVKSISFSVLDVIKTLSTFYTEKALQKNLDFKMEVSPSVPLFLLGDPDRLIQIMSNLVGNAIKFTERGHVLVRFTTSKDEVAHQDGSVVSSPEIPSKDGAIRLYCSVEDTGEGIPDSKLRRIFEKFAQAKPSAADVRGLGLGLAICKQLVEILNGTIHVQSSSAGSTFYCELPFEVDTKASESTKNMLHGIRCLVIDDSVAIQGLVKEVIVSAKGECDVASEAMEGIKQLNLAAFNQTPYHVVIIDYLMSGVDGIEASRRMNTMSSLSGVKRLLLTSQLSLDDSKNLGQEGFHGYLTKPFDRLKLLKMIKALYTNKDFSDKLLTSSALEDEVALEPVLDLSSKVILMADDNQVNRLIGKKMLGGYGCTVLLANDGAQAIEQAKSNAIDLILMDCQMPVKDGYEATQALKILMNEGSIPTIPIVALTANATEKDKEKCLAVGMDDYLSKPIQTKELMRILSLWLFEKPVTQGQTKR